MKSRTAMLLRIIHANTRALACGIAVLLTLNVLVVAADGPATEGADPASGFAGGTPNDSATTLPTAVASSLAPSAKGTRAGTSGFFVGEGGKLVPLPTAKWWCASLRPPSEGCVDYVNKKIRVVFYWNDSSTVSPYLSKTGQAADLNDGVAFATYIDYINKHISGGETFMGFPFDLHGFTLDVGEDEKYIIDNVGKDSANFKFWANKIINEYRPIAALSARSSPSATICPLLAPAGIYNFGTYDFYLQPNLSQQTASKCRSFAISFERQLDLTVEYLKWHQANVPMDSPDYIGQPRVYGFVYAAYKGLTPPYNSAEKAVARLRAAGINIPEGAVHKVSTDLATAQTQMGAVIDKLRAADVNTLIMPDAGVPLNFTHAATANKYFPDYYVWPCSGQDSTGFVRLLNASQWARARGLTCYDDTFDADLTKDAASEDTEWYKAYKEGVAARRAAGKDVTEEPPASAPLVYAQLAPLLAAITAAGPSIDPLKFEAGLKNFTSFRYSGIAGKTTALDNIKLDFAALDGSIWADVARVRWDPTKPRPGGTAGGYVYLDTRRFRAGDRFS